MADVASRFELASRLRELSALQSPEVRRLLQALHGAWRKVYPTAEGKVILDNLMLVLLKPCMTPEEEGERRMVLKILQMVNESYSARVDEDIAG